MSGREPILNVSEPSPLRFAVVLVVLFALTRYLPLLSRNADLANLLVLRPVEYTAGWGWLSAVGHAFAHGGWGHVLMNAAFLVVFAIPVMRAARARGRSPEAMWIVIFLVGAFAGALGQWFWWATENVMGWGDAIPSAVGASGGVSGLFAAAGWAMGGAQQMRRFGVAWLLINALFIFMPGLGGAGIAWAAHLGGFAGGMVLAPKLLPERAGS